MPPRRTRYPLPDESLAVTRHLVAATAIVRDGAGRFLLHRRTDNRRWSLPGGAIEPGESVAAAAERETHEETGYRVHAQRVLGVDSRPDRRQLVHYPDGNVVRYVSITVDCKLDTTAHPLDEHGRVRAAPNHDGGAGETHDTAWFALALDDHGALRGLPDRDDELPPPHRLVLIDVLNAASAGGAYGLH
jgi:8-oxo-dGTP pyrophosphatase MutT (NUDIX family)